MEAKLEFCGNYIEIKNFRHYIGDENNGNPYNCRFDIKVVSGLFSGYADGCVVDYKEFKKFIEQLENLINFKTREVTFTETEYGGGLRFIADNTGHIRVCGTIREATHNLTFEFETDQTVYGTFIAALKEF